MNREQCLLLGRISPSEASHFLLPCPGKLPILIIVYIHITLILRLFRFSVHNFIENIHSLLTHIYKKCQSQHLSYHSRAHKFAYPLECCLLQYRSYWQHQIKTLFQSQNSIQEKKKRKIKWNPCLQINSKLFCSLICLLYKKSRLKKLNCNQAHFERTVHKALLYL